MSVIPFMTIATEGEFKRVLSAAVQKWGYIRSGYFYGFEIESIEYGNKNEITIKGKLAM